MHQIEKLREYRKKAGNEVAAVQLDLETDGFSYKKWGGTQHCKPGDWVIYNRGDTYTVDAETFVKTYQETGPGLYTKIAPVWAMKAPDDGSIDTKEGSTHYSKGDYIVYNDKEGRDGYAVTADEFESMYELKE